MSQKPALEIPVKKLKKYIVEARSKKIDDVDILNMLLYSYDFYFVRKGNSVKRIIEQLELEISVRADDAYTEWGYSCEFIGPPEAPPPQLPEDYRDDIPF